MQSGTVHDVTVNQRRDISEEDAARLLAAKAAADKAREEFQRLAVKLAAESFNGTVRLGISRKSLKDWRDKYAD